MNWYKKATIKMQLDWNMAYQELLKELGRTPTAEEVRRRMFEDSEASEMGFDTGANYDIPF